MKEKVTIKRESHRYTPEKKEKHEYPADCLDPREVTRKAWWIQPGLSCIQRPQKY